MNRTLRVHKIDQLLHNRHHVALQDFLDELEVSLPTFKRDLEFMRLHLNAPIIYDRILKAYRFDKQPVVGPRYELPGLWLNASEAHALLTANSLLESIEPGLLGPHVAPLKSRLLSLLALEGVDASSVSSHLRLMQSLRRHMPVKHFQQVARATLDGLRLRISHFNRNTGETTNREISPQRLSYYRENWYVDGWCHTRSGIRSFAVDAIQSVDILTTPVEVVSPAMLDEVLGGGYGIFNGTKTQWAVLDFSPQRAQWISRIVWHEQQKATWLDTGWYRVEFPYNDDRELLNDILSHTPDVVVQGPPELKAKVVEAHRQALARYQPVSYSSDNLALPTRS